MRRRRLPQCFHWTITDFQRRQCNFSKVKLSCFVLFLAIDIGRLSLFAFTVSKANLNICAELAHLIEGEK